jgi:hypothetical protein
MANGIDPNDIFHNGFWYSRNGVDGGAYSPSGGNMTGPILQVDGTFNAPSYSFSSNSAEGFYRSSANTISYSGGGNPQFTSSGSIGFLSQPSNYFFGWSPIGVSTVAPDTRLYRDSSGTIGQRNGISSQSSRVYNNFTDASNGEWGGMDWITVPGALLVGTANNGIGTARNVRINSASNNIDFFSAGSGRAQINPSGFIPFSNASLALGGASFTWKQLYIDYTNTATVGPVTINKASGRVNIAALGTSVVVTNSLCTVNAHVFANITTIDGSAKTAQVTPAAGSFTITLNTSATGQVAIDFFIVNAD